MPVCSMEARGAGRPAVGCWLLSDGARPPIAVMRPEIAGILVESMRHGT